MPGLRRAPAALATLTALALLAALAAAAQTPPLPRPAAGVSAAEAAPPADPAADPPADPAMGQAADAAEDPPIDPPIDAAAEADLFAMPRVAAETRIALTRFQQGDVAGAAAGLDRLIARHPGMAQLRVNRAVLSILAGEPEVAVEQLAAAAERGVPDLDRILADPVFSPIAGDPRLAGLSAVAPPPAPRPAPVADGHALVSGLNTAWSPASERLEPLFDFPDQPPPDVLPATPTGGAYDLLREHWRRGRAAGNLGDLYDNRDRGHSALRPEAHPQLTHVTYSDAARAADVDYALNDSMLFDRPTLGNSSTALTQGPHWRSMPRLALTRADGTGPMRLWQNADNNHLYFHPAHHDFGDTNGDVFPANTPYLIISRGSSGSDQAFMTAMTMALAAFRPDTKEKLVEERMIVPTLQMVFRRSLQHIQSREAYFSGAAHPVVFEQPQINAARMVSLANSIQPGDIPAQVRLRMEAEEPAREGVDFFGQGLSEQLFDTPGAIARIWRAKAGRRVMTVSAADSRDVNGRPLAFEWRVLQGDPAKVRIEPLDSGVRARITLDWHEPFQISDQTPLTTSRVDIGVFANNGVHDSSPAILSVYFPPQEARTYGEGPDGAPRILSIDYAARPDTYADPLLLARADWRDDYAYDEDGTLTGWTRSRPGREPEVFTPGGNRVLTFREDGSPERAEAVAYAVRQGADGILVVEELSTGGIVDIEP